MATAPGSAIVVENLIKRYAARTAVGGISFHVNVGEVFALLGPNGAGKTSTVEILEGYRHADGGTVHVLGLDPWRQGEHLKSQIGAMLQETSLYPAITPREALHLFAHYYPNPRNADDLLHSVGLDEAASTRFRRLSGGQKQRLSLALALIGNPRLVFLDEPTAGLDPGARRTTWSIISGLRDQGVTVLLTTHYLEEAERLADRVAIMHQGQIIAEGTPHDLIRSGRPSIHVRLGTDVGPGPLESLTAIHDVTTVGGGRFDAHSDDVPAALVEIAAWARDQGVPLVELRVGSGSLEDVFLELTGTGFET